MGFITKGSTASLGMSSSIQHSLSNNICFYPARFASSCRHCVSTACAVLAALLCPPLQVEVLALQLCCQPWRITAFKNTTKGGSAGLQLLYRSVRTWACWHGRATTFTRTNTHDSVTTVVVTQATALWKSAMHAECIGRFESTFASAPASWRRAQLRLVPACLAMQL